MHEPAEVAQSAPIEADSDGDSTFGDAQSDTASLSSSVLNYVYENGRRYTSDRAGQYYLPNDTKEQERLDIIHHIFRLTLHGDICWTKLETPQRILDVGTGTGIWAIDMGDMFPSAEVVGTDLSAIQPAWVPPNVKFEIDDATKDWTFEPESFDFIHARTLGGSIKDWNEFIKQCYRCLKPGGKLEISEGRAKIFCNDGTWPEDCYTRQWFDEFNRLSNDLGLNFDMIDTIPDILTSQKFTSLDKTDRIIPLGPWPKDPHLKKIGSYFRAQFLDLAMEAYSMALFTRHGNWTETAFQVLLTKVRHEIRTGHMHLHTYATYVTAEKPR